MSSILSVPGPNSKYQQSDAQPAGFRAGFWHGLIMPITFFVSLFNPGVGIYEVNTNARWYEFGFVLGASATFGGSTSQLRGTATGQSMIPLMNWLNFDSIYLDQLIINLHSHVLKCAKYWLHLSAYSARKQAIWQKM
jgi:hypothetical protein